MIWLHSWYGAASFTPNEPCSLVRRTPARSSGSTRSWYAQTMVMSTSRCSPSDSSHGTIDRGCAFMTARARSSFESKWK